MLGWIDIACESVCEKEIQRCRDREGDREGEGVRVRTGGCLIVSSFLV